MLGKAERILRIYISELFNFLIRACKLYYVITFGFTLEPPLPSPTLPLCRLYESASPLPMLGQLRWSVHGFAVLLELLVETAVYIESNFPLECLTFLLR